MRKIPPNPVRDYDQLIEVSEMTREIAEMLEVDFEWILDYRQPRTNGQFVFILGIDLSALPAEMTLTTETTHHNFRPASNRITSWNLFVAGPQPIPLGHHDLLMATDGSSSSDRLFEGL